MKKTAVKIKPAAKPKRTRPSKNDAVPPAEQLSSLAAAWSKEVESLMGRNFPDVETAISFSVESVLKRLSASGETDAGALESLRAFLVGLINNDPQLRDEVARILVKR